MNKKIFSFFIAIAFFALNNFSFAQDDMMKIWMEYMTPGKMHELMASQVGEWNYDVTMWMEPGTEPQKANGVAKISMILGGRYQEMKTFGNMMGMDMEGRSITAFDNGKKEFISTWIDNFGTGMMFTTGKYDEATKSAEMKGTMYEPMSGMDVKVRTVTKYVEADKTIFEMYISMGEQEFKSMELVYVRKK